MAKGEISFECKYCRSLTLHYIKSTYIINGKPTILVNCYICSYPSLLYRNEKGKLHIDQKDVPERTIVLSHDLEYRQTQIETEMEELHNKEIEQWMKSENFFGSTKKYREGGNVKNNKKD